MTHPIRRHGGRKITICAAALALLSAGMPQARADFVGGLMSRFADSEIDFARSDSHVPFPPVAFVSLSNYGDTELKVEKSDTSLVYDQVSVSQAAVLPILASPRDALFVGEWVSRSEFDAQLPTETSFDVLTLGLPMGWLRQASPDWQMIAFAMPMGHRAQFDTSKWSFETMAGLFGRYTQSDRLWWAFGLFADVGTGSNLYLPYVGASLTLNEAWTLSAMMPWPAILYAPTEDTLLRLGVSPSGASWSVQPGADEVSLDLGGWDFGLSVDHRLAGPFWGSLEIGVGGLRGLTFASDGLNTPELDTGSTWYVSLGVNLRPGGFDAK
jgi:hypothetical protein